MKPEIKALFVQELRNPAYKKGKGRLREGSKFCVQGVLCNLHAKMNPHIARKQRDPGAYLGHTGLMPRAVAEWAGVRNSIISVNYSGISRTIMDLNDTTDFTLRQMANMLEKFEDE